VIFIAERDLFVTQPFFTSEECLQMTGSLSSERLEIPDEPNFALRDGK